MNHTVDLQLHGGHRRWVCSCGWATTWNPYTDPHAAADAIRHTITANRQE